MANDVHEFGTDPRYEVDQQMLYRDPRPVFDRAVGRLQEVQILFTVTGVCVLLMLILPVATYVLTPLMFISYRIYQHHRGRRRLPLRMPKHMGLPDPSEGSETKPTGKPEGILYYGNLRKGIFGQGGEQVWASNSDARTHHLDYGTTGAGKTETLLSRIFNSLCWGAGFIYIDGKASNELVHKVWAAARRCGREDDVLILNFMQAGKDAFERKKTVVRDSNTTNPMARGSGDFISSLVTSLMPEVSGDSASWREKAVGMIEALIRVLVYMRYKKELLIDPGTIRDYISLEKIIKLAQRNDLPDQIRLPIVSYLDNLSGFSMKEYEAEGTINEEANKQHGYLSGQFTKLLGTLNDTYGHIFKHQLPEVDMVDVVLNDRIMVCLIPSLEKSEVESQGLGRLVVSTLRLMMATALGSWLEGSYEDVVETKLTNAPMPMQALLDELGYYFTKGTAVMFAQARSLNFSLTMSGQDKPAMAKGANREEVESCIANCKIKNCMALEDPGETLKVYAEAAGEADVTRVSGYDGRPGGMSVSYQDNLAVQVVSKKRLTVQELRAQKTGQTVTLFGAGLFRVNCFYLFGDLQINAKSKNRLNQFLIVKPPTIEDLKENGAVKRPEFKGLNIERATRIFEAGNVVDYETKPSVFVEYLNMAADEIQNTAEERIPEAEERGVLLFMRVSQKLNDDPEPYLDLDDEDFVLDLEEIERVSPLIGDPESVSSSGVPTPAKSNGHDDYGTGTAAASVSFKPETEQHLTELAEAGGAADPAVDVLKTMVTVARAMRYKEGRSPQERTMVKEIRDGYKALSEEIIRQSYPPGSPEREGRSEDS